MSIGKSVTALALCSILSLAGISYTYYITYNDRAVDEAKTRARNGVLTVSRYTDDFILKKRQAAQALAGSIEVRDALLNSGQSLDAANRLLDRFHLAFGTSVCYLIDHNGRTLASSNRQDPDSFIGLNFSFRPYFQFAMRGRPALDMALGKASGIRGIYCSHPVQDKNGKKPLGLVVLKSNLDSLEINLQQIAKKGDWLLISPTGLIFATNREPWQDHTVGDAFLPPPGGLIPPKKEEPARPTIGLRQLKGDLYSTKNGKTYILKRKSLTHAPGWSIYFLEDLKSTQALLSAPLISIGPFLILLVSLGASMAVIGLYRHGAARKRMEAETRQHNQALTNLNSELDDFVYIVSHDLREPLRGIGNFSTFLMEDYHDKLDSDGKAKLETLVRLSQRGMEQIDALLHYSRVSRADEEQEEVDPNPIIEEISEALEASFTDKSLEIAVPSRLPLLLHNATAMHQILLNLISNGAKYNDSDKIRIEVGVYRTGEVTEFYVKDNGIGISEKNIPKIFTIFRRLHGREKYRGGTGAGLTIVKKLVERFGGSIRVESTPGKGSTFFFTVKDISK